MPRTKWTDPVMRVMVDPDSIDANHHVRIEEALMGSGKWVVIDRAQGMKAIKKEQERLHRTEADRFDDQEKWSHWGKLYGVGGIVTAHVQCQYKLTFLIHAPYQYCHQYLAIVDANTGQIITAIEDTAETDADEAYIAPSWADAVDKLNNSFPKNFEARKDDPRLDTYRALSKEEAVRQKEIVAGTQKVEPVIPATAP